MKANEVLSLLRISRSTLTKYVKNGTLSVRVKHNGFYDYSDKDVYNLLNKDVERFICLYSRVSTLKQKNDLKNQTELLKQYCFSNGIKIHKVFEDISSGISFEKRKGFFELLDLIIDRKVEKVIILYRNRLSRVGFNLFKFLFKKYNTELIIISEDSSDKLDSEEISEEIINFLDCYSMKSNSSKKKIIIKDLIS